MAASTLVAAPVRGSSSGGGVNPVGAVVVGFVPGGSSVGGGDVDGTVVVGASEVDGEGVLVVGPDVDVVVDVTVPVGLDVLVVLGTIVGSVTVISGTLGGVEELGGETVDGVVVGSSGSEDVVVVVVVCHVVVVSGVEVFGTVVVGPGEHIGRST